MSEYYSRREVERKFSDYEERLEKQQREIERLKFREEEDNKEYDYEKELKGQSLRNELINKYGHDIKWIVENKVNYSYGDFPDYFFCMFSADELKAGYIPVAAYSNAKKRHIRNIPTDYIPYFGVNIELFGDNLEYLSLRQMEHVTPEQYEAAYRHFIVPMPQYLRDELWHLVCVSKQPPLQYKNNHCLLI